jgi:phosphate transport system protein
VVVASVLAIMREGFTQQLTAIEARINGALEDAALALSDVAGAVRSPTFEDARLIAANGQRLRGRILEIDGELVTIMALQAPKASDLRLMLALIEVAHHAGLIANQFELIADQLSETDASVPDRSQLGVKLAAMAPLAAAQLEHATTAFAARDPEAARNVETEDDAIDRLNRAICDGALRMGTGQDEREVAMRQVLIARCLERIADNAVDIAEEVTFLLTAEPHEFTDASHPRAR